jgi:T5SS/PEP-CTERM-associated repeat protein
MGLELAASVGLVASLLFSSANPVRGDDYVRSVSGDFSTTDWYEIDPDGTLCDPPGTPGYPCPPPHGPPGAGDNASLNGQDVRASGGSVMTLNGGGTFTLSGGFSATSAVGVTLQGPGTLTANSSSGVIINGGRLMSQTDVGKTIAISNGGSEVVTNLSDATGGGVASGGALTVNSPVTNLNLVFQSGGTGRIQSITNNHGTGGFAINDSGSALTVDQNFEVNADFLDLSNGGALTVNGQLILDGAMENGHAIGGGGHWSGGANITTSQGMIVGNTVAVPGFSMAVDSKASVDTGNVLVGSEAGSFGTISMSDDGTKWDVRSGSMGVGLFGTGNFDISAGAKLVFDSGSAGLVIGFDNGSRGKMTVDGANSLLEADGDVSEISLGREAGSNGTLLLSNDAALAVDTLTIGYFGQGGVQITSGGIVSVRVIGIGSL